MSNQRANLVIVANACRTLDLPAEPRPVPSHWSRYDLDRGLFTGRGGDNGIAGTFQRSAQPKAGQSLGLD
jgi:hypothetical protein